MVARIDDLKKETDEFFEHCRALNCENALVLSSIERDGTMEQAIKDLIELSD